MKTDGRTSGKTARKCFLGLLLPALIGLSPVQAARVVTLAPHLTELVCAAGACDQLVAVSAYSDYPEQVKHLPHVSDGFGVSYEALLALKPDRVLAWDGGTPPSTIARLGELGLRVESIKASRLDDVASAIEAIGGELGTDSAARAAADAYRRRLAGLRERWRNATPIRVVYQIGTSPAYTINAQSPISDALHLCGGINVFDSMPQIAASIGSEAMLAARPRVVLYAASEDTASIRAYWQRIPGNEVSAPGSFYAVNADWLSRATPRLLDGVEQVCGILDQFRHTPPAPASVHQSAAS